MSQNISIVNLNCRYQAREELVLSEFDLVAHEGELILIKGSNGSGKSTLLEALSRINSDLVVNADEFRIPAGRGMVFQDPSVQFLTFSVKEELSTKLSFQKISREQRKQSVDTVLQNFGEFQLKDRNPDNLSSGQQQKVLILANIIDQPSLVLLDEPFTFLDYSNIKQMIEHLIDLRENGYTLIITTHQQWLDKYADQIIRLTPKMTDTVQVFKLTNNPKSETIYSINGKVGYTEPLYSINRQFYENGIYIVSGKNGSGKSALLLTLAGIQDLMDGELDFVEQVIYIPQRVSYLFTKSTVRKELIGLEVPSWAEAHLQKSPFHLSIGLQRLLAIYTSVTRYSVIIIDEPFQSLDRRNTTFILELLQKYKNSKLIIFSTNRLLNELNIQFDESQLIDLDRIV